MSDRSMGTVPVFFIFIEDLIVFFIVSVVPHLYETLIDGGVVSGFSGSVDGSSFGASSPYTRVPSKYTGTFLVTAYVSVRFFLL